MSEYLETTVDKFIFRVASNRLYSPEGVWAIAEGSRVRFGLTDYLQQLNGDVAFVHVKPVGTKLAAGDEFAELETIKATVSFFAPVRGAIVEGNADLDLSPEVVNQEPLRQGMAGSDRSNGLGGRPREVARSASLSVRDAVPSR